MRFKSFFQITHTMMVSTMINDRITFLDGEFWISFNSSKDRPFCLANLKYSTIFTINFLYNFVDWYFILSILIRLYGSFWIL